MSRVLQGSLLGPILFNMFINDVSGVECTLTKFTNHTKLREWLTHQEIVKGDLDRLER